MAQKVFSLTKALKMFDAEFRQQVIQAQIDAVDKAVVRLNDVVSDWSNRPVFIRSVKSRPGRTTVSIEIDGTDKAVEVFGYVDKGTEPHIIRPIKASRLAFRGGYSAKTQPIANAHVGSGQASGDMVYRDMVQHPGTEAREFIGYAALEVEDDFEQAIDLILKDI